MQKREKFDTGVEAGRNDAALMIAEPGRPGRSRLRSLAARCLAALLLVAFAALLALPLQAQAQTVTTLVDNSGLSLSGLGSASFQAQSFGTGANAGGYTITEVQLRLSQDATTGGTTVAKIREDDGGEPGDLVATLTNPATLTTGAFNTFTAPANTTLDAGTPYWITVNEGISVRAKFSRTDENGQTGEAGWTIGNDRLWRGSESDDWSTSSSVLVMVVKGTVDGGTTTSTDATLNALALSGVTLSPVFAPATEGYTATVANSVTQTTVTATKNDSNATVAITNDDDTNTPNTATVNLSEGANTITVTVTAEDGSTTKTYTVVVTRGATTTTSTDATLSALALSGITLSPVFAPATEGYTATVANSVTQTTVTATKNDSNATVAIAGDTDTSTPNTATVNLSEGANTITVTVTAEDGNTTKTYTVVVTRNTPATGQTSITQTAEGATWTLTGYTSVEAGSTYTFTITLTSGSKPQNEYAGFHLPNTSDNQDKLGLDPNDCTSPKQFCASFTGGSNVTAIWDGIGGHDTISYILGGASPHTATATFKVATGTPEGAEIKFGALKNDGVPRGGGMIITVGGGTTTTTSNDATLSALALSGVTLTPVFAPATEGYNATVANSVTQTTVTATKNDSNATVAITNDDDTNTPNTATVNLSEGANTITVTVTAEDTTTTKTYTVMVTREASTTNANPTFTEGADATRAFNETIGDEAVSTAANIGARITATDMDVGDTLLYSLEGTDAAKFGIIGTNGQIQTKAGGKYSYEANTSYSVMVKVEDGNGGSDTITVTLNVTDQDEAPLAPNRPSVSATAGSTTSLDVTWTPPSNTGRPGITNYDLRYQKTTESGWTNGPRNQTGATASIGSLDAGTAYRVQVLARNPEGDGAWSPSETGSTGAATSCPADAIWCATLTVQNLGGGHRGCANSVPDKECSNTSHLTEDEFTHDGTGYAVTSVQVRSGGELRLFLNPDLTTATQSLVLLVGAERFAFADAVTQGVNYRYWNNTGLSWTSGDVVELKLTESTNTPATGKPKISGAAQVGRTLTAGTSGIMDADGLPSSFTYQWVRVDGGAERNIAGATSKTYTLVQADAGKTFKVKVSFTDDAGNREGPLTSNEYPASGVKGELRLMNDNGPTTTGEGRLEVFFRGEWGTVCDDRFGRPFRPNPKDRQAPMVDSVAPQFACRLMGYATGAVVSRAGLGITSVSPEPEDGGPKIWLDDVLCKPDPTNWTGSTPRGLQHCHHAGWGLENCTHGEDVHLECTGALGQGEPAWMWGTAAQEAAEEALTAAFEDVPSNHDGSSAFTFRIAFSAEVEITPQDMRDHALTVSGGTVTAAARVDGRKDLWELTVEPAGSGPVSILTPLDRACTEAGALCTADGQALSTGLARSVPGPVAQGRNAATPLTAALSNLPAEHDGSHPFTFTLTFSEDVRGLSYRTLRDDAFDVTGGGVTKAKRATKGGNQTWAMTVQPSGNGAVTVILPATTNCTASGAICTNDDRPLSNALAATIHGPVGISVADATVTEGAGAQLDFVVSLSRSATSTVTVDYFTRNGTAIAGQDYTATSGTLTFAAGETTRTVAVPVLDDAHDEGSETMKLKLTNASGARITDRKAIGTIVNSDPLQRAWLSRFGRTVAEQVLEAVGARIEGNSNSPGSAQLTLGGHQVVLGASWPRAEDTLFGDAGVLGQDLRETKYILRAEADESPAQEISTAGLLMASSLHLASADGGDGRWSLWARGSRSSFSGREDALTLKGDVSTGVMGADYERGRVLAGVALAYSTGEGSYTGADARGGEVESTLASAYPYLRYTVSERLSVWGVLGLGEGGLTLDIAAREADEANERIETDVSLAMSAFGARGKLASVGGYDLAVKTDVLFVRIESEAAAGLAAADARTRRLRLTLEGSREVKLESGVLTPSLEVGLRHDGGDAETGSGLELGGGLRWAGLKGFAVEVRARGLLAHEERDYEEWGVSASLFLSPGEGGRGLSMRVGSAWGAASGGVERLWSQRALTGGSFDPDARLDAEVGYGLGAMRGLLTPYTGVALSEGGDTWRAGARFRLGSSLEVSLEASFTEPTGDGEPASGITLRGTKRW